MRGGAVRGRVQRHRAVPGKIQATIMDHVISRGLTMAEAGRHVQPNVNLSTESSIIQTLSRENRYVLTQYCNYSCYSIPVTAIQ